MVLIFALNGLGQLAVSVLGFCIYFYLGKREESASKVGNLLGLNGIFYLLLSLLNFLWAFGFLVPNEKDFILMNTVLSVISSLLVSYSIYKITSNKNILYLLVLFITSVFAVNFSLKSFFIVTLGISYVYLAIVFLELVFFSNYYLKRAGVAGLFYCATSIALLFLNYFGSQSISLLWFVPSCVMFFVLALLYLDIKNLGLIKKEKYKQKQRTLAFVCLGVLAKFMVFVISMSAFILVSTISMHELGHAMVAQYYGCGQFKAVIYDIIGPHTEIKCSSYYNNTILTLAGLAATTAIGLIFLLIGAEYTRGISYLLLGFGLLISYGDLSDLNISGNFTAAVFLLSLIIIVISILKVSVYYLKQQDIFEEGIKDGVKRLASGETDASKVLKYQVQ